MRISLWAPFIYFHWIIISICLDCFAGDLFVLVYSIDNRDSFDEVRRLQDLIFEYKSSNQGANGGAVATGWRKRKPYVPMVIAGNKCELTGTGETAIQRVVETWELLRLAENRPSVGCMETSAKKNINIEESFLKLFMLAKLPTEMTPSLHRKVTPSYVVTSSPRGSRRRMTLRRRLSDAYGAIAVDVRRPSIRTDLLIVKAKQQMADDERTTNKSKKKCIVQ